MSTMAAFQYIGHLGWLDATPDKESKSRAEKMKGSAIVSLEPEEGCVWVVRLAISCGLFQSNGSGIYPISWSEIHNWMIATSQSGIWIAETVKALSSHYVSENYKGRDPNSKSPMDEEIAIEDKRANVTAQFKNLVRKHK